LCSASWFIMDWTCCVCWYCVSTDFGVGSCKSGEWHIGQPCSSYLERPWCMSTITVATSGPLYQPWMLMSVEQCVECLAGGTEVLWESLPLCPPQIPHDPQDRHSGKPATSLLSYDTTLCRNLLLIKGLIQICCNNTCSSCLLNIKLQPKFLHDRTHISVAGSENYCKMTRFCLDNDIIRPSPHYVVWILKAVGLGLTFYSNMIFQMLCRVWQSTP
jgi:hypothetical protein